jgi:hypothetical protein
VTAALDPTQGCILILPLARGCLSRSAFEHESPERNETCGLGGNAAAETAAIRSYGNRWQCWDAPPPGRRERISSRRSCFWSDTIGPAPLGPGVE